MTPDPENNSTKTAKAASNSTSASSESRDSRPAPPTRHQDDLVELLSKRVVGQPTAMQFIVPYIQMHQAGLSPEGRPIGIFLLLGPTGTGKTRTVEALAEVLHGSEKKVLKVDCGEFQTDHEVAKLIGAPPGYLGHRETQPVLTQEKLQGVTSADCPLSLVLFDEIEKAAPALSTLLLGILDRATLTLGDNTTVNFEQSLIFLTSNLGAREMMKEMRPELGFQGTITRDVTELASKLESIGLAAIRRRFSPEFVNRLDVVITYQPLDAIALSQILGQHIADLQRHVNTRLGNRSFEIDVSEEARAFLLEKGTSTEYGARELKRTIHRHLTQPLAAMVATGEIEPGAQVTVKRPTPEGLLIQATRGTMSTVPKEPVVLVVDDNQGLLSWLEQELKISGVKPLIAVSLEEANKLMAKERPDAALVDVMLPDGNGVHLAVHLRKHFGKLPVIIMSGMVLQAEEAAICQSYNFQTLYKPFLAQDLRNTLQALLMHGSAERAKTAAQG
jgi:ATP-dependent Clp protease ATP-binding subunit ClpA/ActR/RegA family two-component response regulator